VRLKNGHLVPNFRQTSCPFSAMSPSALALLAADGIVVPSPSPVVPAVVRARWRSSAARLRAAIAAGAYRINAHAIADGLMARAGRRH
jgi:hypothetical protein